MPIFYNKTERANPSDAQAPKKWYAILKYTGQVSEREVAKQIADETTLNCKEAEMAIYQLRKILLRLLLEGHSVQLGDWGSFYLTCKSEGSDTKEEVSANNIRNLNIRFSPGKELKDAVQRASIVSSETILGTSK